MKRVLALIGAVVTLTLSRGAIGEVAVVTKPLTVPGRV